MVAVLIRLYGWWLNTSRIVYVIDDEEGDAGAVRRFGFAYGTLPAHAEAGEERFCVEIELAAADLVFLVADRSRQGDDNGEVDGEAENVGECADGGLDLRDDFLIGGKAAFIWRVLPD